MIYHSVLLAYTLQMVTSSLEDVMCRLSEKALSTAAGVAHQQNMSDPEYVARMEQIRAKQATRDALCNHSYVTAPSGNKFCG